MSLKVLLDDAQIRHSRKQMERLGASVIDAPIARLIRRVGLGKGLPIGDYRKSWDVLATLHFLQEHLLKADPVMDIGCYCSEVLVSLHRLGFSELSGIDLNPDVKEMPHSDIIRYEVGNFMETPFPSQTFKAVTAISVIEHGYSPESLLAEMSRLIKPGGFFIASFDYWQDHIDTTGIRFFGMDWLIFSQGDVEALIAVARKYGFSPEGSLEFAGRKRVISCAGKRYTFALLVLKKDS